MQEMKRLRYWLVDKILNDNEKYLLSAAINERRDILHKYMVEEKTADVYNVKEDVNVLSGLYNKIKFNNK